MTEATARPVVVAGCGGLAWGRLRTSTFGVSWETGLLAGGVSVGPGGQIEYGASGPTSVLPLAWLDRAAVQHPATPGPAPGFELVNGSSSVTVQMPEWREIVAEQAKWATAELGGAGILVIPPTWKRSRGSAPFLRAWAALGWRFADLDAAHRITIGEGRLLAADGLRVRILEPGRQVVAGNGALADRALAFADIITEKLIRSLGDELASSWRDDQEERVGWYLRQRLAWGIHEGLQHRKQEVVLGGDEPLVCFPSEAAAKRYSRLAWSRVQVRLPRVTDGRWWQDIAQPGYLAWPSSGEPLPGFGWRERDNVLLVGPDSSPLGVFLQMEGLKPRKVQPARLEGVEAVAIELGAWIPPIEPLDPEPPTDPRPGGEPPEEPPEEPNPEPPDSGPPIDPGPDSPHDGEPSEDKPDKPVTGASKVARELAERLRRIAEGRSSDERPKERKSRKEKRKARSLGPVKPQTAPDLPKVKPVEPGPVPEPAARTAGVAADEVRSPVREPEPPPRPPASRPTPSGEPEPRWSAPQQADDGDAAPLADFDPERFELDLPHTSGQLRVSVDGDALPPETIAVRTRPGRRQGIQYELSATNLRHGSIVRIDLDAERGGRS